VKYILATAALLALTPTSAFAALSGYYDSGKQISTILDSAEVADALRQAPIGQISNTGTRKDGAHEWTIQTQECDLTVYLTPVPPIGVGKTTYSLDVPAACQ
jgi:hypothetical protein